MSQKKPSNSFNPSLVSAPHPEAELRPKTSLLAKLKNSRSMDVYRLRFIGPPAAVEPSTREAIDALYIEGRTQALVATVVDAILSFKHSVFLLSQSGCQSLLDNNPNGLLTPFDLATGAGKRCYAGALKELEQKNGYIKVTIAAKTKPMIVEVIDDDILGLIGQDSLEWKQRVYSSVGLQYPVLSIQDSVPSGQDSGFSSQDSGVRSQDSGFSSQDSGVRSQDSGFSSQDSGFSIQYSGSLGPSEAQDRAQERAQAETNHDDDDTF
jgi:hypothetical protein